MKFNIRLSRLIFIILFAHFGWTGFAQMADLPQQLANTITAGDLRSHLTILASDAMEGRETGTPGQEKAAAYIEQYFQSLGLPPVVNGNAYQQMIAFSAQSWTTIRLEVNGKSYRHLWEFYAFPSTNSHRPATEYKEVTFLGYGIDDERYSDYRGVDVKGKVLLIYSGEPVDKDSISLVTGTRQASDWATNWRRKLEAAHKYGAAAVLIIDGRLQQSINDNRNTLLNPRMQMGSADEAGAQYANNLFVSSDIAKNIVGKKFKKLVKARDKLRKGGKLNALTLPCDLKITQEKTSNSINGSNVLGYLKGSDPKLRDELVVVSAHYDHLGKRNASIYNGADDNGSGTSTILEVAQAFVEAQKMGQGPRRSVLFLLVSGEEKGLLGSQYYAEHPVFPLANSIANVNVDMVGRVDAKHAANPNYIYVIGADKLSTDLHNINEAANAKYTHLELDYTYNDDNDPNRFYYRSDHYNFAERGIPAIFYFNGTHEDYHRTTDDVEKINFEKMEKIAQLVFHTSWELANRDERIRVDKKP